MKVLSFVAAAGILLMSQSVSGQDIAQHQVPSVIVNNFQKTFPSARDIEWEKDGEHFKVEFETGLLNKDHDAWYSQEGKMIRHKEEISKKDLPKKVQSAIAKQFPGYRMDDVVKITEGDKASYQLEVKKGREEWKVLFGADGELLNKVVD